MSDKLNILWASMWGNAEMVAKKYKESLLSIEIKNMTVNKITVGNNG